VAHYQTIFAMYRTLPFGKKDHMLTLEIDMRVSETIKRRSAAPQEIVSMHL
jgi:hypothetical protein